MKTWVKNSEQLAVTEKRKVALKIIEAGLSAIDTENVINSSVKLTGDLLTIKDRSFNLASYQKLFIIGFGKASSNAALYLENILGNKITAGVVIDIKKTDCKYIKSLVGSHPKPSLINVLNTKELVALAKNITEKDLVITIVSGGGSSLLSSSKEEFEQGKKLYEEFLKSGGNITELNLVRKHISTIKGGGLAKIFYPATMVGLVFCDVPGDNFSEVASGPTYPDQSTIKEVETILDKYKIAGLNLVETPKEAIYFEKVINLEMVSNTLALEAMKKAGEELGLKTKIISKEIYTDATTTIDTFIKESNDADLILGGGEISMTITKPGGSGGRCAYLAMQAINMIRPDDLFVALASDGVDNSDGAGSMADSYIKAKVREKNLDIKTYLENYDAYDFFAKLDNLIITGPTGANVSDLMFLIK